MKQASFDLVLGLFYYRNGEDELACGLGWDRSVNGWDRFVNGWDRSVQETTLSRIRPKYVPRVVD